MTAIKPLTLVAQYDDLMRCRNALTAGIESGLFALFCRYKLIINSCCRTNKW